MSILDTLRGHSLDVQEQKGGYVEPTSGLRELEIKKLKLIKSEETQSIGFVLEGVDVETGAKIEPGMVNFIKKDGNKNPIGFGVLSNILYLFGLDFNNIRTKQVNKNIEEILNLEGKKIKASVQLFKEDPKSPDDKVWDTTYVKIYSVFSADTNKSAYEIKNDKEANNYKRYLDLQTIDKRTGKTFTKEENVTSDTSIDDLLEENIPF